MQTMLGWFSAARARDSRANRSRRSPESRLASIADRSARLSVCGWEARGGRRGRTPRASVGVLITYRSDRVGMWDLGESPDVLPRAETPIRGRERPGTRPERRILHQQNAP